MKSVDRDIRANVPRPGLPACPACNSRRIAEVLYGEPAPSATVDNELSSGRLVLGGCCVEPDSPDYRCRQCGSGFRREATETR